MNLPTQAQINAATRHIISAVGGAVVMFGLSSKINVDTLNTAINSLGSIVSNLVILAGVIGPLIAGWKASQSASPTAQAESLTKQIPGTVIVTAPEIAAATPNNPNVIANTETQATVNATVKDAKASQ